MPPPLAKSAIFAALPPVWPEDPLPANRRAAAARTLVVLDDDPTGTQTVRDVAVVTAWDVPTLRAELAAAPACFFILTNSRSLTAAASAALHRELGANLRQAAAETSRPIAVASRSDSTLPKAGRRCPADTSPRRIRWRCSDSGASGPAANPPLPPAGPGARPSSPSSGNRTPRDCPSTHPIEFPAPPVHTFSP